MLISKIDLLVRVAKTNANQVLGLPLTVSIRRVEPKTSKATFLEEVPVLAKSRSKEGSKTRSQKVDFLKKLLSNSLEHLHERKEEIA